MHIDEYELWPSYSKYPPAKPEALRLRAPQMDLIATGSQKQECGAAHDSWHVAATGVKHTPEDVKLLLPPGQSRGAPKILAEAAVASLMEVVRTRKIALVEMRS